MLGCCSASLGNPKGQGIQHLSCVCLKLWLGKSAFHSKNTCIENDVRLVIIGGQVVITEWPASDDHDVYGFESSTSETMR